ncbi:MAG: radical SAM family heme chaperone HemW [Armatimonadetes bacterium]|nr:radical SAM family heme chaperone HemW [Armatimonadota bacterium]
MDTPRACREPRAAYVHVPFCVSKCHYCEFNSYPDQELIFGDYVEALILEIQNSGKQRAESREQMEGGGKREAECREPDEWPPLESVYIGGGTPTVLPADRLGNIVGALKATFGFSSDIEATLEANPGTVDESKFARLRGLDFKRLSLGVQSLDDDFLSKIGRAHTTAQAVEAYGAARRAGFDNISIDLMFALPGQTLSHWENTLDQAAALNPEHISLYELSIEEGTRFAELCARGALDLPDEDVQLDMYEMAISKLANAGFEHYEVSNFARPGFRCEHNQVYWRNEPYYGFGAGATSYVCGDRARRVANPSKYIAAMRAGTDAIEFSERLEGRAQLAETIIQGLRMLDGVSLSATAANEFAGQIANLQSRGLLELSHGHLKVTHRGLLLLNDVSREFLA